MRRFNGPVSKSLRSSRSVFDRHQLAIARQTLTYNDVGASVMGGPSKEEARAIIIRLTGKAPKD